MAQSSSLCPSCDGFVSFNTAGAKPYFFHITPVCLWWTATMTVDIAVQIFYGACKSYKPKPFTVKPLKIAKWEEI